MYEYQISEQETFMKLCTLLIVSGFFYWRDLFKSLSPLHPFQFSLTQVWNNCDRLERCVFPLLIYPYNHYHTSWHHPQNIWICFHGFYRSIKHLLPSMLNCFLCNMSKRFGLKKTKKNTSPCANNTVCGVQLNRISLIHSFTLLICWFLFLQPVG